MTNDPLIDVLSVICGHLDEVGVPYAITGSIASSIHGQPYASQDVDICLKMSADAGAKLAQKVAPRFYASSDAIMEAIRSRGMANLVDTASALKVDLSCLPDTPYFDQVLARRSKVEFEPGGPAFWLVSAEDVVLMKLLWRRESLSTKQWSNALSVVQVQGMQLDWPYLRRWSAELGIDDDLRKLQQEAGI
jgi:hypothetical protein